MTRAVEANRIPNPSASGRPFRPPEHWLRVAGNGEGRHKIATARSVFQPVTSTLPVFGSVVIPLMLSSLTPPITRAHRQLPSALAYLATNISEPPALVLDPLPTSVVPQNSPHTSRSPFRSIAIDVGKS